MAQYKVLDAPGGCITGSYAWHEQKHKTNPNATLGVDLNGIGSDGRDVICDNIAYADGVVLWSNPLWGYGNFVLVYHGGKDKLATAYAHNELLYVRAGDRVKAGQRLGKMGRIGNVSPNIPISEQHHLHFEMRLYQAEPTVAIIQQNAAFPFTWIDPTPYLSKAYYTEDVKPAANIVYKDYPVTEEKYYRIRKSWADGKSQKGAWRVYTSALAAYNKYKSEDYHLFADDGTKIF